jgi:hypothetical protein
MGYLRLLGFKNCFGKTSNIFLPVKSIFTKEKFLETVRVVDRKMKKKREGAYIFLFQRDKNTEGVV